MGESISTGILTGDSPCNMFNVNFLFSTPFGYLKNPHNKNKLVVDEKAAITA